VEWELKHLLTDNLSTQPLKAHGDEKRYEIGEKIYFNPYPLSCIRNPKSDMMKKKKYGMGGQIMSTLWHFACKMFAFS